ncbi:hypothetical protein [Herbiconiux liangxiaofengii]|uniref:hypothetical protein n=1 Tax=Herbiconiux liangxiaofengii TaxID=3342795 RepID=UPI0035B8D4CE
MSAPDRNPVPPEPFPWMSTNPPSGRYRMTLKRPLSEALLGAFLVIVGVAFGVSAVGKDSVGAVVVGVGALVLVGGAGVVLLVIASARARWFRAFERAHGRPPF